MINNSKEWATARGHIRKNAVHGLEEWRIPTDSEFIFSKVKGTSSRLRASATLEAPCAAVG